MMDEERKMKDRFRKNLPQFVNKIDPIELLPYLRCLSMQNRETLENRQTQRSRSEAVMLLYQTLARKKDGCQQLVAALRCTDRDPDSGEIELANLLDPQQPETSTHEAHLEQIECVTTPHQKLSETVCKPTNGRKNVREPCCAETAVRNLPYNVVDLLKQLDIGGLNDWKTLAGHLGYTVREVEMLEVHAGGSPTLALIQTWGQSDDATLGKLLKILNEDMQRKDIVSELEEVTGYKYPEIQEQDVKQHVDTNQTYTKDTLIATAVKEAEMIKTELPGTELKCDKQYGLPSALSRPNVTQFSASSLPSQGRHLPNGKMFEEGSAVVDKEDTERSKYSQLKGVTSLGDQVLAGSMRDLGISKEVYAKTNMDTSVNSSILGQESNKVEEVTMLCSRNDDIISSGLSSKSAMMRYKAGENGDLRLVMFGTANCNQEWNDTESFGGELNPFAPRMAKTQLSFGHSECKWVNPIAEDGTILRQDHVSHSNGHTGIGHSLELKDTESFGGELNPFALTMAKTPLSFGHSECKRVNQIAEDGTILQQDHVNHSKGHTGNGHNPEWKDIESFGGELNPFAPRMAKTQLSFGHSEYKRVNVSHSDGHTGNCNPEWNTTESFGGELNPFAPTMAKTQLSFGHSECKRVNQIAEDGTILRQGHVSHNNSNGHTPIQTEPSMSSSSFINLKKERETEKLRVGMKPQRNPGNLMGQECLETDCPLQSPSVSSHIYNYVNLHADDEPRSLDFDETTGSFHKVTTCSGMSCMDETMCNTCINRCSRLPSIQQRPNDTVEHFISTDLSSSIFHSSLHINNETCVKPSDDTLIGSNVGTENCCDMQGPTVPSLNLKKGMDDALIDSNVDNDKQSDRDDIKSETEFDSWSSFMSLLGLGAAACGVLAIAMYKSYN